MLTRKRLITRAEDYCGLGKKKQEKRKKGAKMLSEVYNGFTEGFDTKDLQEAKELLSKLGR